MKLITNDLNLPESLEMGVRASERPIERKKLHVTELLSSPYERWLRLSTDYSEDCKEFVARIMGTAVHHVLEQADPTKDISILQILDTAGIDFDGNVTLRDVEKATNATKLLMAKDGIEAIELNLKADVSPFEITGTLDYYKSGEINDYKTILTRGMHFAPKWEHEVQLNVYRYLCHIHGLPADTLKIIQIAKDWTPRGIERDSRYPDPVAVQELNVWDIADVQKFITQRVNDFAAETPRECTASEKWLNNQKFQLFIDGRQKPVFTGESYEQADWAYGCFMDCYLSERPGNKVAVVPSGFRKAHKVCPSHDAAVKLQKRIKETLTLKEKQGEFTKCKYYCPVRGVCPNNIYRNL